ncbi:MAG: hypothetical protein DMF90_02865 [Acidobacteria bacterium]|nr:MAG: hypothetical protein DMF90_02865 [Acidobacteriota bacterium]
MDRQPRVLAKAWHSVRGRRKVGAIIRAGAVQRDDPFDGHHGNDDPPSGAWFETALDLGWTQDPFDRLLVAHARLRGWRLATGDARLIERLHEREHMGL